MTSVAWNKKNPRSALVRQLRACRGEKSVAPRGTVDASVLRRVRFVQNQVGNRVLQTCLSPVVLICFQSLVPDPKFPSVCFLSTTRSYAGLPERNELKKAKKDELKSRATKFRSLLLPYSPRLSPSNSADHFETTYPRAPKPG